MMRIEGGLSAHFLQPDGSSKPGTDWTVGLKRGGEIRQVMVRTYLDEGVSERTRSDTEYQGQTVLGYVSDLLAKGWTPEQGSPPQIVIRDPKAW
jgi:hypothetical protein